MRLPLTAVCLLICTLLPGRALAQRALTAADHIDIQQLYARYNEAIDAGNAEAWADTFTADGAFNTFKGRTGLIEFMAQWTGRMNGTPRGVVTRGRYSRCAAPPNRHVPGWRRLTWGCVASISRVEVGEASRRPRIVVKEPGPLTTANDEPSFALAA